MKSLIFYLDFASPYSYLSWVYLKRQDALYQAHGYVLIPKPVMMGSLVTHYVDKGPAQIPPKRTFLFKQALRLASLHAIELNVPAVFLFNPILPLRLGLQEVSGKYQLEVIDQLFRLIWVQGEKVDDPERLSHLLTDTFGASLSAEWLSLTSSAKARSGLKMNLKQAIADGCFGVPSLILDNELFWGFESLPFLLQEISGTKTYDDKKMQNFLIQTASW